MFLGELTDALVVPDTVIFRVIGKTISMEAKCLDSGTRFKLFTSNFALMYYMTDYFREDTRHKITGNTL